MVAGLEIAMKRCRSVLSDVVVESCCDDDAGEEGEHSKHRGRANHHGKYPHNGHRSPPGDGKTHYGQDVPEN